MVLKTNQDQCAMEAVKSMNSTIAPLSLIAELSAVPLDNFGLIRSLGMYLSKSLEQDFQADLVSALKVALEENMRDVMSK